MPSLSDQDFLDLWNTHKSITAIARVTGIGSRVLQRRRRRLEGKLGITLEPKQQVVIRHAGRIDLELHDGVGLVFSDAHYWPSIRTTAHRALVAMAKQLKPKFICCNGDAFDGASISRFPRPFFDEGKPSVVQELDAVKERLDEVFAASPRAERIWTLGNHDLRYEARLAANNPEYQGIKNFHLKDHFPEWRPAWSLWVNDEVEIRHRYRNGVHATHTNVQANHHTTITGHLHSLKVTPYTDGRGVTKYGVDTGTLADPLGPQFSDYMEGRYPSWRSGFVVLTWKNGGLLMPELVMVYDEDHVQFRGHVLHADTLMLI